MTKEKDMKIFKMEIPIPNCEGNDVFFQCLYFKASPSKREVLSILRKLHKRDSNYDDYLGTWEDCIFAIETVEEWITLHGSLVQANTFCRVKGIEGEWPLTWSIVEVY